MPASSRVETTFPATCALSDARRIVPGAGAGETPLSRTSYCVPTPAPSAGVNVTGPTETTCASLTSTAPGAVSATSTVAAADVMPEVSAVIWDEPIAFPVSFPVESTLTWSG